MNSELFKKRTKGYALNIMRFSDSLPVSRSTNVVAGQLLRSGTSVGANYRAACRGRSHAEFLAKLCIVVEEADETLYWLELLLESGMVSQQKLGLLMKEGEELVAIFAAARKTAQERQGADSEQERHFSGTGHQVSKSASHQVGK